jgi:hypothetical protein
VSKGSRNQQKAREKLAQMRAQEARRRRRRLWLTVTAAVAVVAAVAVGITLAVGGSGQHTTGSSSPHLKLASLSTLGTLRPAPSPGPVGPEGVPIPGAAPLASTATKTGGHRVDGISCQTSEQTIFHIHAHLTVFINGSPRQIPAGIGIPGARAQSTPEGPFIGSGTCFYWLHTHAADGIIHIESPIHRTYTLGDFFDEWGRPGDTSPRSTTARSTRATLATSRSPRTPRSSSRSAPRSSPRYRSPGPAACNRPSGALGA